MNTTEALDNMFACTDFVCWFNEVNEASTLGGIEMFSSLIVIGFFLVVFMASSRYSSQDGFIVASFGSTMIATFLTLGGVLNPIVLIMAIIAFGVSVVIKK